MMDSKYDVSVIICSYNPVWIKLKKTIESVIGQKAINMEIIICDDGSKDNLYSKIIDYFKMSNFDDYIFSFSKLNEGTYQNVRRGIKLARGRYIKLLSPGDYLYDKEIMKRWVQFMDKRNSQISFGMATYYTILNEEIRTIKEIRYPQNIGLYTRKKYNANKVILNYIFLSDCPNGAMFLLRKELYMRYIDKLSNIVKYAEDCIYRLMVLDGIKIDYFGENNVIWYEYGTGISTQKTDYWNVILTNELKNSLEYGANQMEAKSFFKKKVKFLCTRFLNYKILKYLIFPQLVIEKVKIILNKKYTPIDDNI